MKIIIKTISISLLAILLLACNRENTPVEQEEIIGPGEQEFGWAKGFKDGEMWEASAQALLFDSCGCMLEIFFTTYNQEGYLRESLDLSEVPLQLGSFDIKLGALVDGDSMVGASFSNSGSHGDVLVSFYDAFEDFPNSSIELITVDTVANVCEGFISNIALEIANGGGGNLPDTIYFENIDFSCQIRDI